MREFSSNTLLLLTMGMYWFWHYSERPPARPTSRLAVCQCCSDPTGEKGWLKLPSHELLIKTDKDSAMHSAVSSIQLSFNFFFFLKNLALSNKIEINDLIMKMNIFLFLKIDNFHIKLIPFTCSYKFLLPFCTKL